MSRLCAVRNLKISLVGLALLAPALFAQASPWTGFGPGAGSVFSLAVDPGDAARVFAVAGLQDEFGTLYRSADGGLTWTAVVGPGLERVALDPSRPSTVYAGGRRLLRSLDGGETWNDVSPSGLGQVTTLTVGPDGTVFAADVVTGAAVLRRSADGGASWTTVATESSLRIPAVVADPADPRRVYYGTAGKVRRSLDGGVSWEDAGPLPAAAGQPVVVALATLPGAAAAPSPLLLLGYQGLILYRSDDGATTWTAASALPRPADFAPSIVVDPGAPERWHVTSQDGALNSLDGGRTWTLGSAGLPSSARLPQRVTALAAAPSRPGLLYAGLSEWGVARSQSDGAGWRIGAETGLNAGLVQFLEFDPRRPGTVYLGLTVEGRRSFRSDDGGLSWQPFARDLARDALYDVAVDPADSRRLYAANPEGVWKSVDRGESWSRIASDFTLRLAAPAPGNLLAAGCGVRRSTDGGRTWREVIACAETDSLFRGIRTLWTDAPSPGPFYAVIDLSSDTSPRNLELFRSWDGGARWKRLPLPGDLSTIAVAPGDARVLYAFNSFKTLFRSTDAGESWQLVNGPLPDDVHLAGGLAVDPADARTVYLSTAEGVRVSHDGLRTLSPPLPAFEAGKTDAFRLWTFRGQPGRVYAAGGEGGLFVGRLE